MSVTLDKIDLILERANVTYEEAKEALEKHNGDLVETLIELEKGEKIRKDKKKTKENVNEKSSSFFNNLVDEIKKMHKQKFRIRKDEEQIINIPLTLAVLLIIITFPFSLFLLAILFLIGYKISITSKGSEIVVNDMIKKDA